MQIFLSQRFLPERGGSIEWVNSLFLASNENTILITHNYDQATTVDTVDNNKSIVRENILLSDWGVTSFESIRKYFRTFKILWKYVSKHQISSIHCAKLLPEGLVAVFVKILGQKRFKIICLAHGEEFLAYRLSRQLDCLAKFSGKYTDLLIANSQNTKILSQDYVDINRTAVLHPTIDPRRISSPVDYVSLRRKYGIGNDQIVILTVGRLCPRKNQLGVLRAISVLKEQYKSIHYLIVGTGEEEENLLKYIKAAALENYVTMLGSISDQAKDEIYTISDLYIMPSLNTGKDLEGFGIVYLEAAAHGLPIICGCSGGENEAVKLPDSAISVGTQAELVQAIQDLLSSPDRIKAMSAAGRKFVENIYQDHQPARYYQLIKDRFVLV